MDLLETPLHSESSSHHLMANVWADSSLDPTFNPKRLTKAVSKRDCTPVFSRSKKHLEFKRINSTSVQLSHP